MSTIIFEKKENLAIITFNRPDVLNSFNREMALELQARLDECENDVNVRAILITGEGRAFCAGQDLAEAIAEDAPTIDTIVREHYNPIVKRIRNIEKPIICAVNGVAAGAGANIALCCDIVIASDKASFIQSFSNIGLIPDSGGTFFLPRLVGLQRATAMMFLADKVTADHALQYGMVYKVSSAENLITDALEITTRLSNMPTKGFGLTKRALNESLFNNLDDQLEIEEELQAKAASTYDNQEGINAFLEKRKPIFKGE
ncbi:MAG: enoyl-CoA hydratase/isomerase family protein [Sphingobacteriales bacterium]|nr:enoyl-CoA hydratase/isomerase family protein [Sphingobacteriales bacterium]